MRSTSLKLLSVLFCFISLTYAGCGQKTIGETIDDSVISTKIESGLLADPTTSSVAVEVNVYKGAVQLSGFVDSSYERQRVEDIARSVDGVISVDNNLVIKIDE